MISTVLHLGITRTAQLLAAAFLQLTCKMQLSHHTALAC